MCLDIKKDFKTADSKTRKTVYKVFWSTDGRVFNLYFNTSQKTEYFPNKVSISNRKQIAVTNAELKHAEIYNGFHCYNTLQAVVKEIEFWNRHAMDHRYLNDKIHPVYGTIKAYECKVTSRYHVADGIYSNLPCSVYHKITPIKEIV